LVIIYSPITGTYYTDMPPRSKTRTMVPCSKEAEIAAIQTEVHDLKKLIKGNGKQGLYDDVLEIKNTLPQFKISIDNLNISVRELLDEKIASSTERKIRLSAKQRLAAIITGIIGGSATIVMIVDLIIRSKG